MPGVQIQPKAPTIEIHPNRSGRNLYNIVKEKVALPSPVRSLLASLNKRAGITRQIRFRKKMATRNHFSSSDIIDITNEFEPFCLMATDWAEVVFFHQGSQMVDPFGVQGYRDESAGVSIIPEWQPPSPATSGAVACSRSPRVLLQAPLVKRQYLSDSQGDDESDDSGNDELLVPEVPVAANPVTLPPQRTSITSNSLFTPSSYLSTCNIKFLLSSEKFLALPVLMQTKLLSNLPSSDQQCMKYSNNLDSVLHNEYISAALREWQSQLILGALRRKKNNSFENSSPWKEAFYENYWGDKMLQKKWKSVDNQLYYPDNSSYTNQQKLVHHALFRKVNCVNETGNNDNVIIPLPVQLPLQAYKVHRTSQQIQQEHSYCNKNSIHSTLTLIIGSSCSCQTSPLQVCSLCHKLYHPSCSRIPHCPACIV